MTPPCIHRKVVHRCVICNGYKRWLGERKNTLAARREFWRTGGMAVVEEARALRESNS
jgi:hypothetical protein